MQGVEAQQADFRGCDMRLANFSGAYTEGAMLPQRSPAEIAQASGNRSGPDGGNGGHVQAQPEEIWRQDRTKDGKHTHDGKAGNDQKQGAEQQEQTHGRGGR